MAKMATLWRLSSASAVSCASASAHRHMPMRMRRDAMLPFAEKVGDERPENEPLWQPKIVYPTILM